MRKFSTGKMLALAAVLGSVYYVWDFLVVKNNLLGTTANYLSNTYQGTLFVIGGIVCLITSRRVGAGTSLGRVFSIWAVALVTWGIGAYIWSYYELVLKVGVPYPSLADFAYMTFLPLMGIGLWFLQQVSQGERRLPLLASLPMVVACSVAVLVILNRPDLSSDLPVMTRAVGLGLSLGDAFLISMAMVALLGASLKRAPLGMYIIILAILLQSTADFLFVYMDAHDKYYSGSLPDLLWSAFPLILAVGVVSLSRSLGPSAASSAQPNAVV